MDWISVKDRLPEREQQDYVLVCCTMNVTSTINYENAVTMAYVCEEGFIDVELNKVITMGVTHWAVLTIKNIVDYMETKARKRK